MTNHLARCRRLDNQGEWECGQEQQFLLSHRRDCHREHCVLTQQKNTGPSTFTATPQKKMLYDANDPESLFWSFLSYGRRGRILSVQQELALAKRGRGSGGDGYSASLD